MRRLVQPLLLTQRIIADRVNVAALPVSAAVNATAANAGGAASPLAAKSAPQGMDNLFASLLGHGAMQTHTPSFASLIGGMQQSAAPAQPGTPTTQPVKKAGKAANDDSAVNPMAALANALLATVTQTDASAQPDDAPDASEIAALGGAPGATANPSPKTATPAELPAAQAQTPAAQTKAAAGTAQTDPQAALQNGTTDKKSGAASTTASASNKADAQKLMAALTGRTGAPAPVTEAKATPVRFDATDAADKKAVAAANESKGSDTSANSGTANPQSDPAPGNANTQANNAPPQALAPAQHVATPDATAANSNAIAGAQSAQPQTTAAQPAIAVTAQIQHQPSTTPNMDALAVSIAARSKDGEKHFDIRLDPPDLGRVDVRLSVDGAGRAQAHLSAGNQQTLDLLQRDRTTLERSLKDAGLDLSNNGLNFSLKGQERQSDGGTPNFGGSALAVTAVESDGPAASTSTMNSIGGANARLDIRV